ncbi:MAG TPA: aminotransferase class V-fold PLP-dependent enzyme [Candidatus Methylomirabilis sp.]|nr:aminotransferase class V-fold PLP-dependent enzyme [Candidatus Methylomirabilis sp.]
MKPIYLDHAATTPLDARALEAMRPYFGETFANPASFHTPGLRAKEAVASARARIATHLNCREDEVIFTSGGTESDNLAVVGIVRAHKAKGRHVITSSVEHHAVLEPLLHLKKAGEIELTVLPVDKHGLVSVADLVLALRSDTVLVSIMYANNEIGTIEPIADVGRAILKWRKDNVTPYPFFHTDACQAAGVLDLDAEKLHADLLTLNGSKIYGPKGIGVLYIRRAVKVEPLVRGGGQEKNIRSGTENVPGIVGLAAALDISQAEKEAENARLVRLRDRLIEGLLAIPKTRLNGHPSERLPNNVNVSFIDIEGEAAVLYLDAEGIYTSTGSACASASLDPSHVILATGLSYEAAHGSLRFTLGRSTTAADVERVIAVMPGVVEKLRHMSPVNLDMKYFT